MKKLLIVLVLVSCMFKASSQGYHPLIRSNCYWDEFSRDASICWYSSGERLFFEGDTVLNGLNYSVLYALPIISLSPNVFCPPYEVQSSPKIIRGFMREDTLMRKVFLYNSITLKDSLFYDFSVNIGDSVKFVSIPCGTSLVSNIDSVTLLSGEIRKRITLSLMYYYIEGIGGSHGLLGELCSTEFGYDGWCVKESNSPIWNYAGQQCLDFVGINEHNNPNFCILSPNPSIDFFNITLNGFKLPADFLLCDITGRIVLRKSLNSLTSNISLNDINNGEYFYRVVGNENMLFGKCQILK